MASKQDEKAPSKDKLTTVLLVHYYEPYNVTHDDWYSHPATDLQVDSSRK